MTERDDMPLYGGTREARRLRVHLYLSAAFIVLAALGFAVHHGSWAWGPFVVGMAAPPVGALLEDLLLHRLAVVLLRPTEEELAAYRGRPWRRRMHVLTYIEMLSIGLAGAILAGTLDSYRLAELLILLFVLMLVVPLAAAYPRIKRMAEAARVKASQPSPESD